MLRLIVSGTVQGVGFRWFVKENAEKESIKGWVRNLPDGTVEIVISEADKEKMMEILKRASFPIRIDGIKEEKIEAELPNSFEIRF